MMMFVKNKVRGRGKEDRTSRRCCDGKAWGLETGECGCWGRTWLSLGVQWSHRAQPQPSPTALLHHGTKALVDETGLPAFLDYTIVKQV